LIVDSLVDRFNSDYNILSKDIDSVGNTVSYEIDHTTLLKVMSDVIAVSDDFYWYIDESGKFTFKQKPV